MPRCRSPFDLSDEFAIPGQNGVRRDDRHDLAGDFPFQGLPLYRQASAFIVGEPNPLPLEHVLQDTVLLLDVGDHVLLLPVDPASQRHKKKLPRLFIPPASNP